MSEPALEFRDVGFSYRASRETIPVLAHASHRFASGTFYTVLGPSGVGKTTALMLAGALDMPQSGQVLYGGQDVRRLGATAVRRQRVAFVFQSLNLIPYLNGVQNVMAAMAIHQMPRPVQRTRAPAALEQLGLTREEGRRNVNRLSGGQQQRVAIARALACDVDVILADEPTGNLDEETGGEIVALFRRLAHEQGTCVIAVTHSRYVANQSDQVLHLEGGQFVG